MNNKFLEEAKQLEEIWLKQAIENGWWHLIDENGKFKTAMVLESHRLEAKDDCNTPARINLDD